MPRKDTPTRTCIKTNGQKQSKTEQTVQTEQTEQTVPPEPAKEKKPAGPPGPIAPAAQAQHPSPNALGMGGSVNRGDGAVPL